MGEWKEVRGASDLMEELELLRPTSDLHGEI
jgi:hypothetical protein